MIELPDDFEGALRELVASFKENQPRDQHGRHGTGTATLSERHLTYLTRLLDERE